jgi:hypothetical protein
MIPKLLNENFHHYSCQQLSTAEGTLKATNMLQLISKDYLNKMSLRSPGTLARIYIQ